MAVSSALSQSSLLLPQFQLHSTSCEGAQRFIFGRGYAVRCSRGMSIATEISKHQETLFVISTGSLLKPFLFKRLGDSRASNLIVKTTTSSGVDEQLDIGGVGGDSGGRRGGGGGGDDGGGDNKGDEGSDENSGDDSKKAKGISMSQKITLGYAALVGFGGLMGFMKGGSQKSLAAGGVSAGLLYYVYTVLPTNPVFASSVGLGISAALLVVMGSRFKKSGKIFPAGVVSLVSLIMTAGYMHGIMRTSH